MKVLLLLLGLIAACFVFLLFREEPDEDVRKFRSDDSLTHRFAERFRPAFDLGHLGRGCSPPNSKQLIAKQSCEASIQCDKETRFRYLTLEFDGHPVKVEFLPSPVPDAGPRPERARECRDDGGLSPMSVELKNSKDAPTLVIPQSGGALRVICLAPGAVCTVRAH